MARKDKTNKIEVKTRPNEEQAVSLARFSLQPSIKGAVTIKEYSQKYGDLDLMGLADELSDQTEVVNEGHLDRAEGMLLVQAHTLDAIFNNLAQRAINAGYTDHLDMYLRLALKAQTQCRTTLETLATLKNPTSVAFVRQANIANGPQQINNGVAEISENRQNKVLDYQHGERMDFGTKGATGGTDSTLETVGAVNRPKN